jgi:hypothetical protein
MLKSLFARDERPEGCVTFYDRRKVLMANINQIKMRAIANVGDSPMFRFTRVR